MEKKNFENFPPKRKEGLGFRKKHINPKHKDKKTLASGLLPPLFCAKHLPLRVVVAREREKERKTKVQQKRHTFTEKRCANTYSSREQR